jgi:rhodanese-related sulfurtransferase
MYALGIFAKNFYYMKQLLFVCLSLLAFCCHSSAQKNTANVTSFEKEINTGSIQLLDVRTAAEFKTGYLKNALQADWNNPDQFKDRTQHLDKEKPVYVYCLGGGRSNAAANYLKQQGFKHVISLEGGINAWKMAGKPVENAIIEKQLTIEDYNLLVQKNETILVDFGATWCPPCKKMEPVLQSLQQKAADKYRLIKIDGGVHLNIMQALKVDALPTFIVYKNGKEVWRKQGIVTIEEFLEVL